MKKNKLHILILFYLLIATNCFAIDFPDVKQVENTNELASILFQTIVSLSVLASFGVLVWAGIMWLTSQGEQSQINLAKQKIKNALLGLVIILFSSFIINIINPDLTTFNFKEFEKEDKVIKMQPNSPDEEPIENQEIIYQEIPLGQLAEDILAKNISCFNEDRDLVSCKDPEIILQAKAEQEISPNNHIYYCYEYDQDGNRAKLLENKDRYYCYKLLLNAAQVKFNKARTLANKIFNLTYSSCKCKLCSGGNPQRCYPGGCDVPCRNDCTCCGSVRGGAQCLGSIAGTIVANTDPCSSRQEIDATRQELAQLLTGQTIGEPKSYYKKIWDPEETPSFVTINSLLNTFKKIKEDLLIEYNATFIAEDLMMFPEGDRLSQNEFFTLQSKESNEQKISSKNFSFNENDYKTIVNYCNEYNCEDKDKDGFKESCELNNEDRLCYISKNQKQDPEFKNSPDPATFYFNENQTRNYIYPTLTCAIETEKQEGITKGVIPIGEVIDQSQTFSAFMYDYFKKLIENIEGSPEQNIIGLNSEIRNLQMLPERCDCSGCASNMYTSYSCCTNCGENDMGPSTFRCSCSCGICQGNVCPFYEISQKTTSITTIVNILNENIQNINNLSFAKNLGEKDPNRFVILNLLDITRERLDKCFTKYNFEGTQTSATMDTISCESIYNWRNKKLLSFTPGYILTENKGYFDCYPYNYEPTLRGSCVINFDSEQCIKLRTRYLNNYYCCHGK